MLLLINRYPFFPQPPLAQATNRAVAAPPRGGLVDDFADLTATTSTTLSEMDTVATTLTEDLDRCADDDATVATTLSADSRVSEGSLRYPPVPNHEPGGAANANSHAAPPQQQQRPRKKKFSLKGLFS